MSDPVATTVQGLIDAGIIHRPIDGNHGSIHPKSTDYVSNGIPFIMASDLVDGRIDFEQCYFITEKQANSLRKGFAKIGDVLLSHKASIGRTAIIQDHPFQFVMLTPQVTYYRVKDKDRLSPEYLKYVFDSYEFQSTIKSWAGDGSTRAYIGITAQHKLPIYLHDKSRQDSIVGTIDPLVKKIEFNKRNNETLEQMAQAIFRDWFVDFGPVRRKAAGEADPVAIMGGLTPDPARAAELAALFPAAFGNDNLPLGWSERPLDSIAEFLNGLALQKHPAKPGEPDLPVIKIAELRNGLSDRTNRAARTLPSKYIIKDGDFIFSWSGSLMAKVWTEGEGALNQHLFKVSSDDYPQWFYGLWVHHHMPEFQLIAASKATTMGHIQRMHLTNAAAVCPPDSTIEAMSAIMQPLWDRMVHNELENRTLAETRDYLLPRLMSGAVRVAPKVEVG